MFAGCDVYDGCEEKERMNKMMMEYTMYVSKGKTEWLILVFV